MEHKNVAAELLNAERTQKPIEALTTTYQGLTVDEAYRIQLAQVSIRLEEGRKIVGKKIGLTSIGMQQLLGVNEPDYGHLFDDMLIPEGEPCRRDELIWPRIEGELAFVLKDRLKGPGVNIADVYRATDYIIPAIEIVDSRIKDWKIKLADTIADNASSARFVLGNRIAPVDEIDLRHVGMVLEKNGVMVNNGAGAAVLGNPAAAVAWLANKLASYDIALEPGEIILSGALTAAVDAAAGDVFTVSFHTLGSINLKFI